MRLKLRGLVAAIVIVLFSVPVIADCIYCAYSPSGWGFCRSGGWFGVADCSVYVEDWFSGRTDCGTCGFCSPTEFRGCNGETPPPVPTYADASPCARTQPSLRLASASNLSWVGTQLADVAIF